ncbi:MAG TPA: hypothetical protein PLV13_00185 [Ilumatobacteraceae bacterium]|nr:hypothetical protein [Ilumatobacteraceae bacterium]
MSEHTDTDALKESHRSMIRRGVAAALLLAALSLAEYFVAVEIDDPTWYLMPFIVVKGWVVLDIFMHVRAIRSEGAH